jgi:hypothetical protein
MKFSNFDLGILVKYMRGELTSERQRMVAEQLRKDGEDDSAVGYIETMLEMNELTLDDDTDNIIDVVEWRTQRLLASMMKGFRQAVEEFEAEIDSDVNLIEITLQHEVENEENVVETEPILKANLDETPCSYEVIEQLFARLPKTNMESRNLNVNQKPKKMPNLTNKLTIKIMRLMRRFSKSKKYHKRGAPPRNITTQNSSGANT